ncbi:hypothetical protein CDAR_378911 [Caerostris darwini]|uniref:Small EDRK-rich factor-like N-terminal domain-containing protein n=1 Tax=Caerostris darwini TaxID=1538125 RepID=A0AAV4TZB5_9ARAC|nr:hypothetical protein CDAR_378911 [Caerostris darwini]
MYGGNFGVKRQDNVNRKNKAQIRALRETDSQKANFFNKQKQQTENGQIDHSEETSSVRSFEHSVKVCTPRLPKAPYLHSKS